MNYVIVVAVRNLRSVVGDNCEEEYLMVTIYEQCAFCEEENEFEFESVETINHVQTCKCGKQVVLCSECNHENCFSCKDGCNFKLREEWL
jgi:hypothetical protein